jgi:hypothetical protein
VANLEFVGHAIVHDRSPGSTEDLIARVVLMTRGAQRRQVVLDRIALGDDGLARPAETDLVVRVHVVIETRERVRPMKRRRRRVRHGQRRRRRREVEIGRDVGSRAFVVGKEEHLVLDDRTADAAAIHVASRFRVLLSRLFKEVVGRLQRVALVVLEHAARKLVGAALRDAVHDHAGRTAIFGGVGVCLHLILRHRIERDARLRALRSAAA